MLAIKNNIMAGNAARHLGKSYDSLAKSVERLASGLRINGAKDDAAGMAVRELMRADIAVLKQGSRNAQDGISMLQTMEGAMAVIDENLIRMKELAEQAATGSYSSAQRSIMNAEFAEMADEIDRIAAATAFNGITMLNDASAGTVSVHVGSTSTIDVTKVDMTQSGLNIATGTAGAEVVATEGVTLTSGTYLEVNNGNGVATVTNALVLSVTFNDTNASTSEQTVTVGFDDTDSDTDVATSYTLQAVVDAINTASQNLNVNDTSGNTLNYAMASAYLDTDANEYKLKLDSQASTADTVTLTASGANASIDLAGMIAQTTDWTTDTLISTGTNSGFTAVAAGAGISIDTAANAVTALTRVTTAINTKDEARASFGYKMNRLESTVSILDIQTENLMTAESRISDVDVATEMATLTRTQVLSQAGISMLAQANQMPQMALSLLR
jgi:flagellin